MLPCSIYYDWYANANNVVCFYNAAQFPRFNLRVQLRLVGYDPQGQR